MVSSNIYILIIREVRLIQTKRVAFVEFEDEF